MKSYLVLLTALLLAAAAMAADPQISGELKQWHKVTLSFTGPHAGETDASPNPFTDYNMTVTFAHESGSPVHKVPGYFAADGNAAETSAKSGKVWRAHVSPDKPGKWSYSVSFTQGKNAALDAGGTPLAPFHGQKGAFTVSRSDKKAPDFRARGRLQYVSRHHLRFAETGQFFLKAGADAPETMLAYADFDDTVAPKKSAPLKTWAPHLQDWKPGDPTWKGGKGKGMIGALNYLAAQGMNVFSFLTYNAGGDGDNVWPFVSRSDKLHYDCSKLDQWGIVFDHGTAKGLYLHFKLQENEIDDNRIGMGRKERAVPESLDGGKLGPERKLYIREMVARFSHNLALNWNIGEENTNSPEEVREMAKYIMDTDPYDHNIVIHTFPPDQERVYRPLLGNQSVITGLSVQNGWSQTHKSTLQWLSESAAAGKPWVVANDEQGGADTGVPADIGYKGYDGKTKDGKVVQTVHDIRKASLWGNLMAGGAGVEYYFGYQIPEGDLNCEDFRSRQSSWNFARYALEFFVKNKVPFWEMQNANALVGNPDNKNTRFCFIKPGQVYVVYLAEPGKAELDLTKAGGKFTVQWYDPRAGGALQNGSVKQVRGGNKVSIGQPPNTPGADWVVLLRKS